jgi:hypothetical protein
MRLKYKFDNGKNNNKTNHSGGEGIDIGNYKTVPIPGMDLRLTMPTNWIDY